MKGVFTHAYTHTHTTFTHNPCGMPLSSLRRPMRYRCQTCGRAAVEARGGEGKVGDGGAGTKIPSGLCQMGHMHGHGSRMGKTIYQADT